MKPRPMTNLGSIGGAPDPTTAPEVATGMNKLHADQGYSQANQPVGFFSFHVSCARRGPTWQLGERRSVGEGTLRWNAFRKKR